MRYKKLTAILFADISGYTALMQKDEELASESLRRFQSKLEDEVIRHHGKVANFYGDGALCLFEIPTDGVKAAIVLQSEFLQDPKIPVRMGLHMGTVTYDSDKVFGDSVNITSRIESMAPPGSILLSKKIRDDIKNDPSLQMISLGDYQFKNIEEPVELFAVNADGLTIPNRNDLAREFKAGGSTKSWFDARWLVPLLIIGFFLLWYVLGREPVTKFDVENRKSIAVLPLVNLNSKEENL
ncbi:MAG: adenylate/guanylate cyclase domain-containing protein, partial [Saprospiraceae bacterium]|nr:adenylate/guanylate cyclase domain-containing protein [Saprospiraceae bacterium]